jgi:hypothetical protein
MVAAVGEEDIGRPRPEIVERVKERLPEIRVGRRAAPVQEHEQLTAATSTVGEDEDLVQIAPDELAVQREAHDRCSPRADVTSPPIAQPDPRHDGDEQGQPEG